MMTFRKLFLVGLVLLLAIVAGCGDKTSADGGKVFTAASAKNTDSKINVRLLKLLVEDRTDHEIEIVEDLPASPQILRDSNVTSLILPVCFPVKCTITTLTTLNIRLIRTKR